MTDIVLIILDTLRRDRLSIYGHHQPTSPEFDAFAADATLFERAIAPAQWTVPSHASMFTGVYPTTHQLTEASFSLSPHYETVAQILHRNGYHTAGFCNNPLVGLLNNGLQRGFVDFFNYAGAAPNRPLHIRRSGMRKMLSHQWRKFARAVSNQFAHSDWLFRVSLHPRFTPIWTRSINYKGHTQRSIDDMMAYIQLHRQRRPQDKPLFTFLNLMGTHLPYRPPEDFLPPDLRKDASAYRVMNRFNADAARWASPVEGPLSAEETHIIERFYEAEIAHQDHHLGRLLRYLSTLDDTMVIVAADHGEGHGDHNFFGHSFVVYQELVHVPLVIRYPEHYPAGKRIHTNISTRRLFHTILDAAHIQQDDPLSLSYALNGKPDTEQGMAFAEAFPPQTFLSVIQHRNRELIDRLRLSKVRRGIYADSHKLAVVDSSIEGLFNIQDDPAEVSDISQNQPSILAAMQTHLNQFVQDATEHRRDHSSANPMSDDMQASLRALGYIE